MQIRKAWQRYVTVALAIAITSGAAHAARRPAVQKETFPKIGLLVLGTPQFADASFRASVAKADIAVLGMYRGWKTADGLDVAAVIADIRARADAAGNKGLILSKYTNITSTADSPSITAKADIYNKMSAGKGPGGNAVDWWARNKAGLNLSSWPGNWSTNLTRFVKPDADGLRVPEWMAERDYKVFFAPSPALNGWYEDAWFWKPRVTADWNGDGVDDDPNSATVQGWYRQGYADWVAHVHKLAPDVLLIGNVDGKVNTGDGLLSEPEFKGKIGGALFEGAMGIDWSIETWGRWTDVMKYYRALLANTKDPHIVMFGVRGDPTDYQFLRYSLGTTLLDDGYFTFAPPGNAYHNVYWFDEFDLAGTAGTDWLGRAVSPPATTPWSNGVYRRDFENGIVLVNPKGNGAQTVTVEAGFRRIRGVQAPAVNNGQAAGKITLQERDGILLVRETPVTVPPETRPAPPELWIE